MGHAQEPMESEPIQGELPLPDPVAERSWLADLLASSRLYHSSKDYKALLDFVTRLRNFAPFNAMLLQAQKPGLTYAASAWDWQTRFGRTVKEGARPLVILWPFAPVAFVYDVLDTEGDPLPKDVDQTFYAAGSVTDAKIQSFLWRLGSRGIEAHSIPYGDGYAGHVKVVRRSHDKKEKPHYRLRLNANHALNVQFVTLVHELGHLFLGHLGPDEYLRTGDRRGLSHARKELEAESLTYLVAKRHGVASKSESYLADYVAANTTVDHLDLDTLFKAAGQVETALGIEAEILFEPRPRPPRRPPGASILDPNPSRTTLANQG